LSGVVDAGDYVLWRETLGSNDPRADGSGPTTGVPDGVVDQFDFVFWRANFGQVGVPVSGSGTGGGEMAAANSISEPVLAASTPSRSATLDVKLVDEAFTDLPQFSPVSTHGIDIKPLSRLVSPRVAPARADSLLLINTSLSTRNTDESLDVLGRTTAIDLNETDRYFATLDEAEVFGSVGLLDYRFTSKQ